MGHRLEVKINRRNRKEIISSIVTVTSGTVTALYEALKAPTAKRYSSNNDIYGRLKNIKGKRTFIPFRQKRIGYA